MAGLQCRLTCLPPLVYSFFALTHVSSSRRLSRKVFLRCKLALSEAALLATWRLLLDKHHSRSSEAERDGGRASSSSPGKRRGGGGGGPRHLLPADALVDLCRRAWAEHRGSDGGGRLSRGYGDAEDGEEGGGAAAAEGWVEAWLEELHEVAEDAFERLWVSLGHPDGDDGEIGGPDLAGICHQV